MCFAILLTAIGSISINTDVLCGIDALKRDGFKAIENQRVALITNHTGLDRKGNRTIDLLHEAPNVHLVKLFSPEHGLFGKLDEKVGHAIDEKTGLRVFSLYGETRRPTPEMLADIDTIVFDIQDIGTRFYTYISTMGYAMEAAARHGKTFIVLDRPNPITGTRVSGPPADKDKLGFVAYAPIPIVHAMTAGELAMLFNKEYRIGCDLKVVKMEGWMRSMWWDETHLMWVNPSPNMRNLTQATLYPAVGLLEMTNLSVGRGTNQPFEYLGAPWIDGRKLAAALNGAKLPGLRFVPMTFTPDAGKFANEKCQGIYILVTDRNAIEPARCGLTIAWQLKRLFGKAFEMEGLMRLLCNREAFDALKALDAPSRFPDVWQDDLRAFRKVRTKYLLYK